MAMRKNDIEQTKAKSDNDNVDDIYDDETDVDEAVEDIDIKQTPNKNLAARKRLEDYLEEKRLRKELGDDLFDF